MTWARRSGAQKGLPAKGASARIIRPDQVFAFDGFFAWKLPTPGETKTNSVEEMAVVTVIGATSRCPHNYSTQGWECR